MSDLFLILHKVRGEPAFDIAQRVEIGKEEGWIIPTSGHRAYPYWSKPLTDWLVATTERFDVTIVEALSLEPMPPDHPDHYDVKRDDGSLRYLARP